MTATETKELFHQYAQSPERVKEKRFDDWRKDRDVERLMPVEDKQAEVRRNLGFGLR